MAPAKLPAFANASACGSLSSTKLLISCAFCFRFAMSSSSSAMLFASSAAAIADIVMLELVLLLLSVAIAAAFSAAHDVIVPLRVPVALVGFNQRSNVDIDVSQLRTLLSTLLPTRRPRPLSEAKSALMPVVYKLAYDVQIATVAFDQFHRDVAANAALHTRWRTIDGTFHVDAQILERFIADSVLPTLPPHFASEAAVIVLSADAQRIYNALPAAVRDAVDGGFSSFRYGYAPVPANVSDGLADVPPAHTWLSSAHWIAADVSAVPIGTTFAARASVTPPATLPIGAGLADVYSCLLRAVVTAVRTAIVPDIAFHNVEFKLPTLVIPLVVLEESAASAAPLDLVALERSLAAILAPRRVHLVPTRHSLHDHTQFLQALRDANQHRARHVRHPETGQFLPVQHPYVDGAMLREEVRDAYDLLGAGLWRSKAGDSVRLEKLLEVGAPESPEYAAARGSEERDSRVFPIYLFSTQRIVDSRAFFDDAVSWPSLSADKDLCLVLQTPERYSPLGMLANGFALTFDARAPEGAIAACVANVVDSVAPPTHFYSELHEEVLLDTEWSNGHHPFALGAAPGAWSQRLSAIAHRNHLLALASEAYSELKSVNAMLHTFVSDFISNDLGNFTSFDAPELSSTHHLLWFLEDDVETRQNLEEELFSHQVVQEMRNRADQAQLHVDAFVAAFVKHDEAESAVLNLHAFATSFSAATRSLLMDARQRLKCCKQRFRVAPGHQTPTSE